MMDFGMVWVLLSVLFVAWAVLTMVGVWQVLGKMGRKPWAAIVPFYNMWELACGATKIRAIAVLAVCMPVLGIGVDIASLYVTVPAPLVAGLSAGVMISQLYVLSNLSRAFNHGFGFAMGLFFLTPVFMMVLGFSQNERYIGPTERHNMKPSYEPVVEG